MSIFNTLSKTFFKKEQTEEERALELQAKKNKLHDFVIGDQIGEAINKFRVNSKLIVRVIKGLDIKNVDAFLNTKENIDVVARALVELRKAGLYNQAIIDAVLAAGADAEKNVKAAVAYVKKNEEDIKNIREITEPFVTIGFFPYIVVGLLLKPAVGFFYTAVMLSFPVIALSMLSLCVFKAFNSIYQEENIVPLIIKPPVENNSFTAQLGEKSIQYSPLGYAAYFASYLNPRAYLSNEHNEGVAQGIKKTLRSA